MGWKLPNKQIFKPEYSQPKSFHVGTPTHVPVWTHPHSKYQIAWFGTRLHYIMLLSEILGYFEYWWTLSWNWRKHSKSTYFRELCSVSLCHTSSQLITIMDFATLAGGLLQLRPLDQWPTHTAGLGNVEVTRPLLAASSGIMVCSNFHDGAHLVSYWTLVNKFVDQKAPQFWSKHRWVRWHESSQTTVGSTMPAS